VLAVYSPPGPKVKIAIGTPAVAAVAPDGIARPTAFGAIVMPLDPVAWEEALRPWFTAEHGVLVCVAVTGTGKTLIAEATLFEALHSGMTAYYNA
jgi:hypothetical protein